MEEPNLFSERLSSGRPAAPLAVRLRPRTLSDLVGQQHVLGEGSALRQLLAGSSRSSARVSIVLWGPPGTGKTTIAMLVAGAGGDSFVELSAVTAGVKDVRAVIEAAKRDLELNERGTVLFIDEVHRFSKTQQDALLPAVENGWVTLVAATTENPGFSVIAPLLSRSLVVALRPLEDDDLRLLLERAVDDPLGLNGRIAASGEALTQIIRVGGGDARRSLTVLDAAAAPLADGATLGIDDVERAVAYAVPRYDRSGDQHYDVASALIKSIRGSDVDAAMHYLARMVEAGEDPRFIARRLVILASEDIGMADPSALQTAVAAMSAVSFIGWPEARITLAQAVVHLSLAPKSNSAYRAINDAIADVRAGLAGPVPLPLRDGSSSVSRTQGAGQGYRYPHDDPSGLVAQRYAPDAVADRRYYQPTLHGEEARWAQVAANIAKGLGRAQDAEVGSATHRDG
ncbi:MAG: replication-associated recombination protein A [Actinomycetes bacterium]